MFLLCRWITACCLLIAASALQAQRGAATVIVRISDRAGARIGGVDIVFTPHPVSPHGPAVTRANGIVTVRLAPGRYRLHISKSGFASISDTVRIKGKPITLPYTLEPAGILPAAGEYRTATTPVFVEKDRIAFELPLSPLSTTTMVRLPATLPAVLQPYTVCSLPDGLHISQFERVVLTPIARDVQTDDGKHAVHVLASVRVDFAASNGDPYASAQAEKLAQPQYAQDKQWLLDHFRYQVRTTPGAGANHEMRGFVNGLETRGFDKEKLEGDELGSYVIFDDAAQVVTNIQFLNRDASGKPFKDAAEYGRQRDQFLNAYTFCIRADQH